MVFIDPKAPANERFRMVAAFGTGGNECIYIHSSGDGIHWRQTHHSVVTQEKRVTGHHLDSQNVIFWDGNRNKYVAFVRKNRSGQGSQGRTIARGEAESLTGFGDVMDMPIVFGPDEGDLSHGATAVVDFYIQRRSQVSLGPRCLFHVPSGLLPLRAGPIARVQGSSPDQRRGYGHPLCLQPGRHSLGTI